MFLYHFMLFVYYLHIVETDYLNVPGRLLMSLVALPRPLAQTSRPAQPPPCRPGQPPRGGECFLREFLLRTNRR